VLRGVIGRPVAVSMAFLALVLIGVLSYGRIPVDLLPSVTYPRLTVMTVYEDIPAEDLERLVTRPLEEVVTALAGVRRTVSRTREGVSLVTVEYEWGTDMDFAGLHLRESVDRVAFRSDFPEDAERPSILRWDPTSRAISILVLEGSDRIDALTEFAREVVKPALEQVNGISQAEVVGGSDREILVRPDPTRLAIYGVDLEDIRAALVRSNVSFPGGKIRQGPLHLSLRIAGEYETLDEIARTEILRAGRGSVTVADVAEVIDTVKEPEGATLLGGTPVVSLLIYKEPEANTLQASGEVDRALEVLSTDYPDFAYSFVYRDAEYVRASFQGLVQSLVIGSILAFFVLFLFLSDARSPLVVGVSIPVSIAITFALLYFGNVKLNLMSLGGLSLAAGMLVDNAIVVLENINRHLRGATAEGPARRRLIADGAARGTGEVARAVLAATLTTIAVFFPVVYVPGIAGAFFRDQALTVTFALLVSVAAALLLQPTLAGLLLDLPSVRPSGVFRTFQAGLTRVHHGYHRILVRALARPRAALAVLAIVIVAGLGSGVLLDRGFMPARTAGDTRLDLELAAGTPLEETQEFAGSLARWIDAQPGVRAVFTQVGRTERTLAAMQEYVASNTARIRILLEPGRDTRGRGEELQALIATRLSRTPGVRATFREEGIGLGELLATGEAPFTMGVVSDDAREAANAATSIASALADVEGLTDLKVDRVVGAPNLVVELDREAILRNGLDPDDLARELRNRVAGVEATTFNEIEQRIDIAVRLPRESRLDLRTALETPVALAAGESVPLRSFLRVSEERPVRELVRRDQRRMVSITGDVEGRSADAVWTDAVARAGTLDLPGDVMLVAGGEQAAMRKSFQDLAWAMLLAIALVYMILAGQFESFLDPLLIAAVIPIGIAGAAVAVGITGNTVNVLSLIGLLALLGIAVNDAIVKVDTIRRLRDEGMDAYAAILEASRLRFRPIVMTSVTTVLAMLPMAIGLGSGEQLQRPLAVTIIGGLTLTTLLTLVFTPVLYMVAHRIRPAAEPHPAPAEVPGVTSPTGARSRPPREEEAPA